MIVLDARIPDKSDHPLVRLFESEPVFTKRTPTEHHHSAFEISYIRSGHGIYRIRGKEICFDKGDIFLFSTNEVHCITEIDPEEKMVLLNLHFEPRFLWSSQGDFPHEDFLNLFLDHDRTRVNLLSGNSEPGRSVAKLMIKMYDEAIGQNAAYDLMIKNYLVSILITLLRSRPETKPKPRLSPGRLADMEQALNFIDENLTRNLSLDEIAAKARISRTYFCSAFKKLNGLTPWEYIGLRRIELARHLLRTTDRSVLDISFDCGFNNISHFNRLFKNITGLCPAEYRKQEPI